MCMAWFYQFCNGLSIYHVYIQCCTGTRSAFRRSGTSSEFCGTSPELVPIWKWPERNGTTFLGLKLVPFQNWCSRHFCKHFNPVSGCSGSFINQWCVISKYLELVPKYIQWHDLKEFAKLCHKSYYLVKTFQYKTGSRFTQQETLLKCSHFKIQQ